MTYDVISYILIGSLFVSLMVPLIALLRKSSKEQKLLDEAKAAKKYEITQPKVKDWESYIA